MKVIKDKEEWKKILKKFKKVDVFYTYDFMKVNCVIEPGYPEAIYYEDENLIFFYPYIRRPLFDLPYVPEKYRDYSDITAPYGVGGPLFEGDVKKILPRIKEFFLDTKTVSEFVRFHPLIENYKGFEEFYYLIEISPIVYIDLYDFKEELRILKSFRKGHRADIKYALKKGYVFKEVNTINELTMFYKSYIKRMKENKADKRHFFPFEFFESLLNLRETKLYSVIYNDKPVCWAFFLLKKTFATYFISVSVKKSVRGANHFLIFSVIKEILEKKYRYLSLGGGIKGEDSLLTFKRGFSKKEKPYFISRKVYIKEIYEKLVNEFIKYKNMKERPKLFPQYREI